MWILPYDQWLGQASIIFAVARSVHQPAQSVF